MKFKTYWGGETDFRYITIEDDGTAEDWRYNIRTYDADTRKVESMYCLSLHELLATMFAIRTFLLETKGAAFVNPEPSMIPIQRLPDDTQEI